MSDRQHWVFFNACGCPFGVLEGTEQTQGEAWREFYEGTHRSTDFAVGRAVARGVTMMLVSHEEYVAAHYQRMLDGCPH